MTTIKKLKTEWEDTEQYHQYIKELFEGLVDSNESLKKHRDFVQQNGFGFGERAFWWVWKLILDETKTDIPKLMEIGVYKSATLSLWRVLKPIAYILGITPLNTTGDYPDFDYRADIKLIHDTFNQQHPNIVEALSSDTFALNTAKTISPFDVIYIDGSHEYLNVVADLVNYSPMVKLGGFLVMDDACSDLKMPWGFFQGHKSVTEATLDFMEQHGSDWEFITNVVHLRIYRKK